MALNIIYLKFWVCHRLHRDPILMPSYYSTMALRWYYDGIARLSRSRIAFLNPSGGSWHVRNAFVWQNFSDGPDGNTKEIRRCYEYTRCIPDGLTMGKMITRTCHEYGPSGVPSGSFWHAKDFDNSPEVTPEVWQIKPEVNRWLKMGIRIARWYYDHSRIWKNA